MKSNVKYLIFIFFLFGTEIYAQKISPPEYIKYVNELTREFENKMFQEFNLKPIGSGGSMPYNVSEIEVIFSAKRRATIDEARAIEVAATEKLLEMINQHEKIRPFLEEHPFGLERTCVRIYFYAIDNSPLCDETVYNIGTVGKNIYYQAYDLIDDKIYRILTEPFEEAQKIVNATISPTQNLRIHTPNAYEDHLDQVLLTFAETIKKEHNLDYFGKGSKATNGIEQVALKFMTHRHATLEEARELHVKISEQLAETINRDEKLRPYLKEYPFKAENVNLHISFKTPKNCFYSDGSVGVVYQKDDKITYMFYFSRAKDTNPKLHHTVEETYGEAVELIKNNKKQS